MLRKRQSTARGQPCFSLQKDRRPKPKTKTLKRSATKSATKGIHHKGHKVTQGKADFRQRRSQRYPGNPIIPNFLCVTACPLWFIGICAGKAQIRPVVIQSHGEN